VILTLACGKYRFNKMDLGDIAASRACSTSPVQRRLQCHPDRVALAGAFNCGLTTCH